ncbi:MAG: glycoside hydrolase family 172 protein, partial [Hominenteromicrobium sp.]
MTLFKMENRRNFGFSAENPTGTKGGGTRGKDCEKLNPCIQIQPGETVTLCDTDGPGMVTHMWFTGYVGHSFILRIYWENNEQPSVEAPFSAFFGCAYDENFSDRDGNYPVLNSAAMLVAPGRGFNSYFEMPFRKHCRITMENRGEKAETLFYMISGWYGEIPENSGYFHATYRQEHPVQKGRSYVILDGVHGKGCFAGVTLASGMNGHNTCWVEGEAKMYIDGDTYPTMNYTGTEDYFCGSYGFGNDIYLNRYQTFSGLYTGLYAILGDTKEMYNHQKRFMLYRWHVKDPVYFDE